MEQAHLDLKNYDSLKEELRLAKIEIEYLYKKLENVSTLKFVIEDMLLSSNKKSIITELALNTSNYVVSKSDKDFIDVTFDKYKNRMTMYTPSTYIEVLNK